MFDLGKEIVMQLGDKTLNGDPLHANRSKFNKIFKMLDDKLVKLLVDTFKLEPHEERWVESYHSLLAHGYQLRRRFEPGYMENISVKGLFDPDLRGGLTPIPVSMVI